MYNNLCNKCKTETYKYSCLLDYDCNINKCPSNIAQNDEDCEKHFEKVNPKISEIKNHVGLCKKCRGE